MNILGLNIILIILNFTSIENFHQALENKRFLYSILFLLLIFLLGLFLFRIDLIGLLIIFGSMFIFSTTGFLSKKEEIR